jgi:hypothetical protein
LSPESLVDKEASKWVGVCEQKVPLILSSKSNQGRGRVD